MGNEQFMGNEQSINELCEEVLGKVGKAALLAAEGKIDVDNGECDGQKYC